MDTNAKKQGSNFEAAEEAAIEYAESIAKTLSDG